MRRKTPKFDKIFRFLFLKRSALTMTSLSTQLTGFNNSNDSKDSSSEKYVIDLLFYPRMYENQFTLRYTDGQALSCISVCQHSFGGLFYYAAISKNICTMYKM